MKTQKWLLCLTLIAACITSVSAASADAELPDVLPAYYIDALIVAQVNLDRVDPDGTGGLPIGARRASYSGNGINLVVEGTACEPPRCAEINQLALSTINKQVSAAQGECWRAHSMKRDSPVHDWSRDWPRKWCRPRSDP